MSNNPNNPHNFTHVYSNINGNSNNFNFNEEIINNNNNNNNNVNNLNQREAERQIKELKNMKYRQLVRAKYSDYLKKKRQNANRTECE